MATRIRLQRKGRKGYPFYHIVIADQRAPRDGKFIEKIGTYNPNVNPIALEVNVERALYWLGVGAEPTDTTRNLLSEKGVMMKKHLLGGVAKGAFSAEEAEKKFEVWMSEKEKGATSVVNKKAEAVKADEKARFEAEKAANKARAEAIAKKTAVATEEVLEVEAIVETEEVVQQEQAPEAKVEVAEATVETVEPAQQAPEAETPAEEEKSAE